MQFDGISAAAEAVCQFYYVNKPTLPTHMVEILDKVIGMTRSPVDAVVKTAEVLYANLDSLTIDMKELAAACAELAARHGFHGMDIDSRGDLMALVLREKALPTNATIPLPITEYLAPSPFPT
jgi:hypothetical protein